MRTRMLILELGRDYLKDGEYQAGWIPQRWIDTVTEELKLKELSDEELANMWDMVFLTTEDQYMMNRLNEKVEDAMNWMDVQSAFTEVVNIEARRRR